MERENVNSVRAIIDKYLKWAKYEDSKEYKVLSIEEKDNFRLQNDEDAKYYFETEHKCKKEALCADTIVSFWTPFSLALYLNTGWHYSKTSKSLSLLIEKIDKYKDKKVLTVCDKFEDFAKVCYTKGNFILLPDRKMNNDRFAFCEDRIDESIYQCFSGGTLARYFHQNDDIVCKWIEEQNLGILFNNGNICKNNLNPILTPPLFRTFYMKPDFIYTYINECIKIINERNK